jgi:pyruvate/2-oxoacid:ferredoxin oxidoreductase alpha subunit/NAD-dependent dihydropyrimidine dehydrogenase PreA subunit
VAQAQARPKPVLHPEYCKACGRCLEACAHEALSPGADPHPLSGAVPVVLDLGRCNGCGLCVDACPEPYGLVSAEDAAWLADAAARRAEAAAAARPPADVPDEALPLPPGLPLVVKGAHAGAIGALLAGCRHFFGYPITPSTEGAELMAKLLPGLGGTFLQASSEVAAVNMMFGCGGAGRRAMTFTSSPGFSLMVEGISYLVGAEIPAVFVNVMRAGPGLGNVGPAQADLKLACRGLGHGDTHAIVLAPATPQEMLDLTMLAFELAFRWRNPVVLLADGYLGQMTGRVVLPDHMVKPGLPGWAVWGDAAHRRNLHTSIQLDPNDQEEHVLRLAEKYARIAAAEARAAQLSCDDAEVILVACNTPAQIAKGAVRSLRGEGIRAGLFRPQTVWPFPARALLPLVRRARRVVVVEASDGQLEDEMRLALSHAGAPPVEIGHVRRLGGNLPSEREIVEAVRRVARGEGAAA